MLKVLQVRIKE